MLHHHCRCQSTQKLFDKDFLEKNLKIKELTISVTQLEKVIEQKNVEIGETLSLLDQVQTECKKALKQVMLTHTDKIQIHSTLDVCYSTITCKVLLN